MSHPHSVDVTARHEPHDLLDALVWILPPAQGPAATARASATARSTSSRSPTPPSIVEQVNGGNQTVPTLVFADGSALTNPSVAQVKAKLAA